MPDVAEEFTSEDFSSAAAAPESEFSSEDFQGSAPVAPPKLTRAQLEALPQFQKESPSLLNKAAQLAYNPTLAVASIPHAVGEAAAGLMNLPFYAGRAAGLIPSKPQPQFGGPDIAPPQAPFGANKPLVQIPFKPTNMQPEAPEGIAQANKVLGMATPETAAVIAGTMGAGAPEAAAGYFAPKMVSDLPADLTQRYQTIAKPGSTWREKAQEVLGAGVDVAMAAALMKAATGIESAPGIPGKEKIQVRSLRDDLNKMVQRESEVRAKAAKPEAPVEAAPPEDVSAKAKDIVQKTGMTETDAEAAARSTITPASQAESETHPLIADYAKMDSDQYGAAIKQSGIGVTGMAYRLGEKLTAENIPALEKARTEAYAQQKEMVKGKPTIDQMQKSIAIGMKGQMFSEAIKWRKALDLARESGASSLEDFAKIEKDLGVGERARGGTSLKESFDKEQADRVAKPAQAAPVPVPKSAAAPAAAEAAPAPAAQPAMVGMGAAASGEVPATGDASVTGLAERVRGQREASGQTAPTQPGQGISPEASVERGRALLPNSDPERIMSGFEQTGRVSADDFAVARARTEQLAQATNQAEERFGTDSPEFRAAFKTESDWSARTKKMQTEWAKSGAAQQGEVDVDTGTFSGLARAFKSDTGKDFTPEQAGTAKKISKNVKVAAGAAEVARKNLYDQLDLELGKVDVPVPKDLDEARMQFAKYQSGTGFTPQQVKTLWNVARKFYLDRGVTDFDDIRNGLATDFGMKVQDVTRALGQSKGTRRLTDDMWKKQQSARRLDQQAKRWLTQTALPKYRQAMESVPRILFGLKVGFHGTVALGTHAPAVAFQPRFWNTYVRDFGKMYHMVASPAYYEMQVQDLMRRQNYTTARRAGLVNDPFQYEDYNSPKVAEYFSPLTGMGNRGYTVLKILRQDMFDQHWNNLPDSARTPEVAKAIADGLNHATGVVKGNAPKGANIALFAPRLEASRVAWLTVDPVKAANTFARWKTATPAEKYFAINQVKEKAWVLGTMTSILALNQGFLMATGSKQKINFANPMKSDWMKFKAAGMDLSYGNAMLSMARLPVRLYQIRESTGGKLRNLIYPDEDTYSVLGQYGRSQLSPFASLATELWLKGDWENRPLPDSTRPVPKRLRAQGVKPYTWPEFWAEQLSPIPAEEAMRDVWKNGLGMTPEQIASASKAMATLAVMSGTGARLTDDVQPKK
jgi:hypothetical protein